MGTRTLTIVGFGLCCLLVSADEPKQKVQVSHTDRIDLPSGGTLRLNHSIGVLTIGQWDQPGVEITIVKTTAGEFAPAERDKAMRELDKVRVATARQGNEVVISTDFPRARMIPPYPREQSSVVDLEYHIKTAANTKLIVDHRAGEVNVDTQTGDIDISVVDGQINLRLPDKDINVISAKTDVGAVNSDFRGPEKPRWLHLGHEIITSNPPATRNLRLRVGYGDIVILKTRRPQEPSPAASAAKSD